MESDHRRYRLGEFVFNPHTGDLVRGREEAVRLRPQASGVLEVLVERAGSLVTREEIQNRIWSATVIEFDQAINACIREVRRALGDSASDPRFIETFPRRGYRYIGPVEVLDPPDAERSEAPRSPAPTGSRVTRSALLIVLLLTAATLIWRTPSALDGPQLVEGARPRVLVLPVRSPGSLPALDSIALFLTDRLIGDLAAMEPRRLGVIARTSALQFADSTLSPAQLDRRLDLDYVVEASLRAESGTNLRVSLIDTHDETHRWVGDISLMDGPAAASEAAAQELAAALLPGLPVADATSVRPRTRGGRDLWARAEYLLGLHTMEDTRRAEVLLERGLEMEPATPAFLSGLAEVQRRFGAVDSASALAQHAVDIDVGAADAHRVLGSIRMSAGQWDSARTSYRRALEYAPAHVGTLQSQAFLQAYLGEGEAAVRSIRRALELDPVSSSMVADAGMVYLWAGRYGDARSSCRAAIELRPSLITPRRCLVFADWLSGRPDEAAESARALLLYRGIDPTGDPMGRFWTLLLEEAGEDGCGPVDAIRAELGMGRAEAALARVRALAEERPGCLRTINADPLFEPVRSDPVVRRALRAQGLVR